LPLGPAGIALSLAFWKKQKTPYALERIWNYANSLPDELGPAVVMMEYNEKIARRNRANID
jgi:hypothetical protein